MEFSNVYLPPCLGIWCLFFALPVQSTYLYFSDRVQWSNASETCQQMGYILAQPKSEEETKLMLAYLDPLTSSSAEIWLGGKLDDSKTWRWSDGSAITWTDWAVDAQQPNDIDREKCLRLRRQDEKWWNRECDRKYAFVCQSLDFREACFNLLKRNLVPGEIPLVTYSTSMASECTLKCLQNYKCELYSVEETTQTSGPKYLCKLFTSGLSEAAFRYQASARLYTRLA